LIGLVRGVPELDYINTIIYRIIERGDLFGMTILDFGFFLLLSLGVHELG
jgi:hypothetical protein